jgi:ribosome-binding factor A
MAVMDVKLTMTKSNSQEPSQRQLRVGEEIRHALAAALARGDHLPDPALADMNLTVTEVRMTPDLKIGVVYVRPLGGGDVKAAVKLLAQAAYVLRKAVAKSVRLRYVPQLRFMADTSFDEAAKIDSLLALASVERIGWTDPNDDDSADDDDRPGEAGDAESSS